jgi:hypothetical protein
VSWYTQGGFTDEYGKRHESGHHYKIDYWEVLNEIEGEHQMTPETYTRVYDAIVAAIRQVQPQMKFVGLAVAWPTQAQTHLFYEYFLNPKNHKPGIPLDMISYHFYAIPGPDETSEIKQYTFFEQADKFLDGVRYIEMIRQRLSPQTRTPIDELGSLDSSDFDHSKPEYSLVPQSYWSLSSATYAYVYAGLARQGIDVAGESQMVGFPTQFPSVSMVDWNTGQPNTRYWVLKLIHDNLGPGDKMVETNVDIHNLSYARPYVYGQAFVTRQGWRKLLLVNKRDRAFDVSIPDS